MPMVQQLHCGPHRRHVSGCEFSFFASERLWVWWWWSFCSTFCKPRRQAVCQDVLCCKGDFYEMLKWENTANRTMKCGNTEVTNQLRDEIGWRYAPCFRYKALLIGWPIEWGKSMLIEMILHRWISAKIQKGSFSFWPVFSNPRLL